MLFIFSAYAGSAIPLNDLAKMLDDKYFTDIQIYSAICIEDSNLGMDVFCVHMILAIEYSY